ncbi:acyltransferase family protein [Lysinibacter sp. HNR]|uniref:acyltransferase family protein n=1 Tax=Lysinibacter sp. HNR TaxID=3031408 RepID=UPI002435ABAE|nr:acyltransferase family protein [Lysinibacter sp. HNR]WGD38655.1 acyltransferase family protein [Lysinibacter sp. HNR]
MLAKNSLESDFPANTTATNATTPQTPPLNSPQQRFSGLDGLRAIAVIFVLVYHLTPGFLRGGFIGVDIFFVISGFLITSLLLREKAKKGKIFLFNFWQRRARRLLPALALVVLVCSAIAFLVGGDTLVNLGPQIVGAATFSSNWIYIAHGGSYFTQDTPELFRNLWSLAVEEQFYIIWPLALILLLLLRKHRARIIIVALLGITSALLMALNYTSDLDPTRVYFGSDTHSFGLFIGAGLALILSPYHGNTASAHLSPTEIRTASPLLVWGMALLSGSVLIASAVWLQEEGGFTYEGGLLIVSLASAGLIWAAVNPVTSLGRMLDVAPLRYVGERSYGLYLWHWPLFVLINAMLQPRGTNPWIIGILTLILTVILAHLSYRFLEQPARRLGLRGSLRAALNSVSQSRMRFLTSTILATVFLAGIVGSTAAITVSSSTNSATANILRGEKVLKESGPTHKEGVPPKESPTPEGTAPSSSDAPGAPQHPQHPQQTTPPSIAKPNPLPPGTQITAIGDSVMLASAPELQSMFPGITIDATVSRGLDAGVSIAQTLAESGQLREVVVIGLGTNGPIKDSSLEELHSIAAGRLIILMTAYAPRQWIPGVNDALAAFTTRYNNVELGQWHNIIAAHTNTLAGDQIHPGQEGGELYAGAVRLALQKLVDRQESPPDNPFGIR